MPYDPNFPPDHQDLNAAPFRNQYNALKALNDAQAAQIAALTARVQSLESGKPSMDDVNAAIVANSSANCEQHGYFDDLIPPTRPLKGRCGALSLWHQSTRLNVLILGLHRQ